MSERCHGIRKRLSAYADGELSAADEQDVRAHVADCADCRAALAEIALVDQAIASEDVSRPEEDWERLASRVDAAVERAHERDRHAARTQHGWRRHKKPGFLGGLLPAPVAFGSAGTLVAAVLVVLMHGLLEERSPESDLLPADEILAARGRAGTAAADSTPPGPPKLESLGMVGSPTEGKGSEALQSPTSFTRPNTADEVSQTEGRTSNVADPAQPDAPRAHSPAPEETPAAARKQVAEEKPIAEAEPAAVEALRAVEPELRIDAPESAPPPTESEESEAALDTAAATGDEDAATDDAPAETESAGGKVIALADEVDADKATTDVEVPDPRTLNDFAKDYAKQRATKPSPPPQAAWGQAKSPMRPRGSSRPDAMTRTLEEQRRQTDEALSLALAREVYLFAQERRREGDTEGAITALSLLLDNEHGRIREQAWADLISLEGENALEGSDVVEIARVGSAADAFLREYPSSRFRLGVIKRRIRLWARAVELDAESYCEPARAAEAEWQATFGAQSDPDNVGASERIRAACGS